MLRAWRTSDASATPSVLVDPSDGRGDEDAARGDRFAQARATRDIGRGVARGDTRGECGELRSFDMALASRRRMASRCTERANVRGDMLS